MSEVKGREIKFRVWRWNYEQDGGSMDSDPVWPYQEDEPMNERFEHMQESFLDEKPDVLMQYTGLKDKNGVEIYEGDVVTYTNKSSHMIITSSVVFDRVEARFGIDKGEGGNQVWAIYGDQPEHYEVIGNIYENPEILEANND